jgi:hypothetical protein
MTLSSDRPDESNASSFPAIVASRSAMLVGEVLVLPGEPSDTSVMVMSELAEAFRECVM